MTFEHRLEESGIRSNVSRVNVV